MILLTLHLFQQYLLLGVTRRYHWFSGIYSLRLFILPQVLEDNSARCIWRAMLYVWIRSPNLLTHIGPHPYQGWIDQYRFAHPFWYLLVISRKHVNPPVEKSVPVVWRGAFCLFWRCEVPFVSFHQNGSVIMLFIEF